MQMTTLEQFRSDLLDWGEENLRSFPWRNPAASLYEVLVAEFFLTQTPADNVATIYPEFIDRYDSLSAIDGSDEGSLATTIEPLGFHNMWASALKEIAAALKRLPRTAEGLRALPRVVRT